MIHRFCLSMIGAVALLSLMPSISFGQSQVATTFNPPADKPTPKRVAGGSSREGDRCTTGSRQDGPSLTAILPISQFGTTIVERPVIFVYLPDGQTKEGFFSLKDQNSRTLYEMNVSLDTTGGVLPIQLPEDAPILEIGEDYQWYFVLKCSARFHPSNPFVEGWIRRVEMDPSLGLHQDSVQSLIDVDSYGAAGIWYDTLRILADLQYRQPTDSSLTASWSQLLDSVGLEEIASAPFVELN